jgi:hypothetical protein
VLAKIEAGLPIRNVLTIKEVASATIAQRFSQWLFAALAGLACLPAVVGI